jgi:probable biosynthetic protein (TIGR04098 family)
MRRSRSSLQLGMPHTRFHALGEAALLAHAGDLQWAALGESTGVPASRQRDADGRPVYASFYYVEVGGFPPEGLAAFGPDDRIEIVSEVGRFGRSMMDGYHRLHRLDGPGAELPEPAPPGPFLRLSNVLVALGGGADDLRIATPANADIERLPTLAAEPDSYRTVKLARTAGRFVDPPAGAEPLWEGARRVEYEINPDRDVNGVGLLYFANFVVFTDFAERRLLHEDPRFSRFEIDRRVTVARRIGYYGNAQPHDRLEVECEAWRTPGGNLLFAHRVFRSSDGRLIAVTSVEKHLEGSPRDPQGRGR